MEQYVLAIDTSTKALTVALLKDHQLIAEDGIEAERNHSIYLLPVIQRMLAGLNLNVHQLHAVAVGAGPGSYTGVRIGVTVAKTLAWSLKIPLIGVSSLSAYAHAARVQFPADVYIPMMDARRGQVYSAMFADKEGIWQRLSEDMIVQADSWLDQICTTVVESGGQRALVVGDFEPFRDIIDQKMSDAGLDVHCLQLPLSAYHIGLLARLRMLQGQVDDLHDFVPNYTQLAEAEAKLLNGNG